jgi:hypothetical protein
VPQEGVSRHSVEADIAVSVAHTIKKKEFSQRVVIG